MRGLFSIGFTAALALALVMIIRPPAQAAPTLGWAAGIDRVDVLINGKPLRWNDGNCAYPKKSTECVTKIYELPVAAHGVSVACSYHYEMTLLDIYNAPNHAPYIHHWPIDLANETTGKSLGTSWSAQPLGHVYAHMHIIYDSHGHIKSKKLGAFPDHTFCDNTNYAGCYWDVDPERIQVVSVPWSPKPGDYTLRCTLRNPTGGNWQQTDEEINQIEVHVPRPPMRFQPVSSLHPAIDTTHAANHTVPPKSQFEKADRRCRASMKTIVNVLQSKQMTGKITLEKKRIVSIGLTHDRAEGQSVDCQYAIGSALLDYHIYCANARRDAADSRLFHCRP